MANLRSRESILGGGSGMGNSGKIQLRIVPMYADLDDEITGLHQKIRQLKGVLAAQGKWMGRFGMLASSSKSILAHFCKFGSKFRRFSFASTLQCKYCGNEHSLQQQATLLLRRAQYLKNFQEYTVLSRAVSPLMMRSFHATGLRNSAERSYYEILGVSEDANQEDIKKAFHALAKKHHPDANRNNPVAKRKFQEIREAYETLRDPDKRAQYNEIKFSAGNERVSYDNGDFKRSRTPNQNPFSGSNHDPFSSTFYHIFSEVFENERERFASDIQVDVSLSFSEAASGCIRHISFGARVICDSCHGIGYQNNAKPKRCPTCRGSGRVTIFPFTSTCSSCNGRGQIIENNCSVCGGSGVLKGTKNVDVTIPAGVDSGDTIHVPKAGNSGGRGVHPGDLHIKLNVAKDPVFSRDGADIYVDSHISFTQAVLGGKIEVPTLSGKQQLKIPRGIQPGQLLVLRGKGLPRNIGLIDHGDQYVRFRVHFPISVNERQRAILEEFAKEEEFVETNRFAAGNWWGQILIDFQIQVSGLRLSSCY